MKENLPPEEWRVVAGGAYEISNLGRVRNTRGWRKGRVLKSRIDKDGYLSLSIYVNKRYETAFVHGLVADGFLGPRPEGREVNHIDGVKLNNAPSNLEYVTSKGNKEHAVSLGLMPTGDRNGSRTKPECLMRGEAQHLARLTKEKVVTIRAAYDAGGVTIASLARKYVVSESAIRCVVQRSTWRHVA